MNPFIICLIILNLCAGVWEMSKNKDMLGGLLWVVYGIATLLLGLMAVSELIPALIDARGTQRRV